ncbi:MAG: recombinase family protein [Candidatus Rokubacteria bacterium]|nr:recombinase family protein [Candidatus Rokubacteria bacterium]
MTTRAAIYARYSSDQQRETSIEDQSRNCLRLAEGQGWKVEQRYEDKAISGGIAKGRPGYQQMLRDAEAGLFDVLIVDDLSRLSRDDIELKKTLRRFVFKGLRIVGASDGFDSAAKGYKLQAGLRGIMNEAYLDDLRDKTRRGLEGRAIAGYSTGSRLFGYRPIAIEDATRKDAYGRPLIVSVRREIDPEQAQIVGRIFALASEGWTCRQIALTLNNEGIASPRAKGWSTAGIRATLTNETYHGEVTWNRRSFLKNPDTEKRNPKPNERSAWIVREAPELRIVSDDLWQQVREQMAERSTPRKHKGRITRHLFSGMLVCGCCGGSFSTVDHRLGCRTNADRGPAACKNNLKIKREVLEDRLLTVLQHDLFTPDAIVRFKREVARQLRERTKRKTDAAEIKTRIAGLDKQITRIVEAIATRGLSKSPSLADQLIKAEADKQALERQLAETEIPIDNVVALLPNAIGHYRRLLARLPRALDHDLIRAQNLIRGVVSEITLRPNGDGTELEAIMRGRYHGLIELGGIKGNEKSRERS